MEEIEYQLDSEAIARADAGARNIRKAKKLRDNIKGDNGPGRDDHEFTGKLGEEIFALWLKINRPHISASVNYDTFVVGDQRTMFSHDVAQVSVKTCNPSMDLKFPGKHNRMGPTWMLKRSSDLQQTPVETDDGVVFKWQIDNNCPIVFVKADHSGLGKIYGWSTYGELRSLSRLNLLFLPFSEALWKDKRAVYLTDLKNHNFIHPMHELQDAQIEGTNDSNI